MLLDQRSYDENFHPWKVISIKFHPSLDLKYFFLKSFSKYYQEIVYWRIKYLSSSPFLLSSIVSQFLLFSKDKCVIFLNFLKIGTNFVGQLAKLHCWESLKGIYLLSQKMKLRWFQLTHALPREWKESISMHNGSFENVLIQDHHLVKKNQIICLTKLNSNELYKIWVIIKYE